MKFLYRQWENLKSYLARKIVGKNYRYLRHQDLQLEQFFNQTTIYDSLEQSYIGLFLQNESSDLKQFEHSLTLQKIVEDGYMIKENEEDYKITLDGVKFRNSGGYVRQALNTEWNYFLKIGKSIALTIVSIISFIYLLKQLDWWCYIIKFIRP